MPLADSNGPDWVRRQKAAREGRLAGAGPIRRFLTGLFRRSARPDFSLGNNGPEDGAAGAGSRARLLPRVPVLSGAAARRFEDDTPSARG